MLQGKFGTFKSLLQTSNTATSADFKEVRKGETMTDTTLFRRECAGAPSLSPCSWNSSGVRRDLKNCEKKIRDLRLTVDLVQNDRAQFAHIDDFELEKRTKFISDMKKELEEMQQYFEGDEVKRKMIADERIGVAKNTGALGATNSDEAENTHFIVDKQAEARMIMQQQDEDLTELGQGVDRLNEMSMGINQELQTQNRMLNDLDRDIDEAAEKMNFVMGKLAKLLKTKDTCQICVILALTFILIVLILLVMYS